MLECISCLGHLDGSWVHSIAKTHVRRRQIERLDKRTISKTDRRTRTHTHAHTHTHTAMAQKAHPIDAMDTKDYVKHSTRTRIPSHYIIEQQQEQEALAERVMSNHRIGDLRRHRRQREDTDMDEGQHQGHDQQTGKEHHRARHHQEEEGKETRGNDDDHASKTCATTTATGNEPAADGQGGPRSKRPRRSHAEDDSKDDQRHHSKATRGKRATLLLPPR